MHYLKKEYISRFLGFPHVAVDHLRRSPTSQLIQTRWGPAA